MWTYWSTLGLAQSLIIDHLRVLRQNINDAAPCWGSWWSREWSWKCSVFINRLKVSWNESSLQLTDERSSRSQEETWYQVIRMLCSAVLQHRGHRIFTNTTYCKTFLRFIYFTSFVAPFHLVRPDGCAQEEQWVVQWLRLHVEFPCTSLVKCSEWSADWKSDWSIYQSANVY